MTGKGGQNRREKNEKEEHRNKIKMDKIIEYESRSVRIITDPACESNTIFHVQRVNLGGRAMDFGRSDLDDC